MCTEHVSGPACHVTKWEIAKPEPAATSKSCSLQLPGAMADRKAELEKKRKKLEELKRAREQNKLQSKDKEVISSV